MEEKKTTIENNDNINNTIDKEKKKSTDKGKALLSIILLYIGFISAATAYLFYKAADGFDGLAVIAIGFWASVFGPLIIFIDYKIWESYYDIFAETKHPVIYSLLAIHGFYIGFITILVIIAKFLWPIITS